MKQVVPVCIPGVVANIEMFTLADEDLQQFVVYTYYDEYEEPLYIGYSKDFYNSHYFNSKRLDFFDEVKYIGFMFTKNESEMKESKKYYIRARQPKYGRSKYSNLPYLKGCDVHGDDFVVSREEMEKHWTEFLRPEDKAPLEWSITEIFPESDPEKTEWVRKVRSIINRNDGDLKNNELTYVATWFDMGVSDMELLKAYETTVIRTGSFSWTYMHSLLKKWMDK